MSFIQTELDHAAFIRSAAWPDQESWLSRPLDDALPCMNQPVSRTPATIIIDEIAASGLPGLAIPLLFILTVVTPPTWLLAAIGLPLLAGATKIVAPRRRGAIWLSIFGYAALALSLTAIAADHAAAAIASASTLPTAYLVVPLTAVLMAASWFMARRKVTLATRDLLVIEGLTLALTLIILANHATLGGTALTTYQGATPLGLIAADVGLTTLSPILGAGIAFSFFIAGLRSCKALVNAQGAIAAARLSSRHQ
ncbi:MAG TPA: hypothetical protein VM659_10895 [Dongiaceae bacterium]|nr:hypothetical protein [Dongiaceae bacterium]